MMKKRIFTTTLSLCSAVLLTLTAVSLIAMYVNHSADRLRALETALIIKADCIESGSGLDESFPDQHTDKSDSRYSFIHISADGSVITSGTIDNTESLMITQSPAYLDARDKGEGKETQYPDLVSKRTILSTRLSDSSVLCAVEVRHSLVYYIPWVIVCLFIAFAISLLMSFLISNRTSSLIKKRVSRIDLSNPESSAKDPEFKVLMKNINNQNEQVKNHIEALESDHRQQDKMRREFTANVSHELKTPLTSVSGYAEIIRDGIVKEEDVARFAGKIYDESQRMITLVGDIIKLSQLDENEISVNIERIDLYDCCQAVITSLEHQARKKNVTFSLEGEHAQISGAEVIIEEIIHNICDNAVKYNRDGGSVNVSIKQCIDGVELTVTDTGIGIPKDDLEHVFERFYRVDKSHSKEIGGTGLGLSIVKHGAMFHNASVSIDSTLGAGTTVRILF